MSVVDVEMVEDHERFRAELASVAPDGKRKWIYARKPNGRFYALRTIVSWLLLAFLLLSPYIKVGGHQFLLFNIIERQFVFFGVPFWPNDFYLVALMFLIGVVTIVLFTATLGRFWCGWLCPQTIFMEMVFRKIEWLIDGPPKEQAHRDGGPWSWTRVWRFGLKITVFFAISFLIANTFLAYILSSDTLLQYIAEGPIKHLDLFIGLVFFTVVFFLVFYRYREQACIIACPYGRYMSALVDEHTLAVTYDFKRGEQRAKWTRDDMSAKKAAAGANFQRPQQHGDCVDCFQCVTVCPTGIDIRNGIQLECVNCTACIDACDEVMDKVGMPRGLIRYSSHSAISNGHNRWFTKRTGAYIAVWSVLMVTLVVLFALRTDLDVKVLRQEGSTWVTTKQGLGNVYRLQVINKSNSDRTVRIVVVEPRNAILIPIGLPEKVKPQEIVQGRFIISVPKTSISGNNLKVQLQILSNGERVAELQTTFLSP